MSIPWKYRSRSIKSPAPMSPLGGKRWPSVRWVPTIASTWWTAEWWVAAGWRRNWSIRWKWQRWVKCDKKLGISLVRFHKPLINLYYLYWGLFALRVNPHYIPWWLDVISRTSLDIDILQFSHVKTILYAFHIRHAGSCCHTSHVAIVHRSSCHDSMMNGYHGITFPGPSWPFWVQTSIAKPRRCGAAWFGASSHIGEPPHSRLEMRIGHDGNNGNNGTEVANSVLLTLEVDESFGHTGPGTPLASIENRSCSGSGDRPIQEILYI